MKIFLDIDGVLVHANPQKNVELSTDGFYVFNSASISKLNSLISENDEIILSTSHRFKYSILEWLEIFKSRGININNLSIIEYPSTNSRKNDIFSWIKKLNLLPDEILIIDDDKSLNDLPIEYKNKLILTNAYTGLI